MTNNDFRISERISNDATKVIEASPDASQPSEDADHPPTIEERLQALESRLAPLEHLVIDNDGAIRLVIDEIRRHAETMSGFIDTLRTTTEVLTLHRKLLDAIQQQKKAPGGKRSTDPTVN